jgi:NAD-dependent SIR2 family protein deacetylase
MKTVFILGAGASVEAGAPLMGNFLATAKRLHADGVFGADSDEVKNVLDAAFIHLKPVQAKSTLSHRNIEELFSAIDMGALLGVFGSRDASTLPALQRAIRVFIYRTIEETVLLPRNGRTIDPPKSYKTLAQLTFEKLERSARVGLNDVSFITFNYDTCLEYALGKSSLGVDYGLKEPFLDQAEGRYQVKVPVLKLHGSVNWAECPKCDVVVPTVIDTWRNANFMDVLDQQSSVKLEYGPKFRGKAHNCGTPWKPFPYMVPPTWDKASASNGLQHVWQRAAKELGSADNIVVIGYSMPVTDTFFRYLFALGSDSDVELERFVVINGPAGQESDQRFRDLLGPTSAGGFQSHPLLFSGAQRVIRDVLFGV